MRLYCTVMEIWCLKDNAVTTLTFWRYVTSSVTWPFDSRGSTFYGWSIVTMRLSGTVTEIWRAQILNARTWTRKERWKKGKRKRKGDGKEGKGEGEKVKGRGKEMEKRRKIKKGEGGRIRKKSGGRERGRGRQRGRNKGKKSDVDTIEKVQRRFTKRIPGFGNYDERLNLLHLPRLEIRRLRYDLIWCYKILFWSCKSMFVRIIWLPSEQYTWAPLQVIQAPL